MSLYGRKRDIGFIHLINKELINRIITQQIGYYKLIISDNKPNLYGENLNKNYKDPIILNCLYNSENPNWSNSDVGYNISQKINVWILRNTLDENNILPELGDIILFRDNYYEIISSIENNFLFGKDPNYSYSELNDNIGDSLSFDIIARYISPNKLNIENNG